VHPRDKSFLPDTASLFKPFDDSVHSKLADFYYRKKYIAVKSLTTAALLSVVIPGAGKIYTGEIGDGVFIESKDDEVGGELQAIGVLNVVEAGLEVGELEKLGLGEGRRGGIESAGDGSLQMNFHELATAMNEKLPVMICLLNNGWLGMVKQWQKLLNDRRYSGTDMGLNPDFVALAKAYGADGIKVERPSELADAFRQGLNSDLPTLIDIRTDPEEDVLPMQPGGMGCRDVIMGRCNWGKECGPRPNRPVEAPRVFPS